MEAHGCDSVALQDPIKLDALFACIIREMSLHPLSEAQWHKFPGAGGVTGMLMLTESHLTCHTFPEYRSLCLNLFCCRPRQDWDFEQHLREEFGAASVRVRRIDRPYTA